jgi:uncharacterized protein with von Willebrand factor type A (vWA) domain
VGPEGGTLLHNLLLFGRLLRGLGLNVNTGRMLDLVQALDHIQIGHKSDFYHAARSLLVHRREDLPLFDRAFALFWQRPRERWEAFKIPTRGEDAGAESDAWHLAPPSQEALEAEDGDPDDETQFEIRATVTYSQREALRHKDFAELTAEEMGEIKRLMAQLSWHLGQRKTRRWQPGSGEQIDQRRTLRRNLRYGGQVMEWVRLEPKVKPRPLVVIADISGSMERYTRLLLRFIYGLSEELERVEAFVFSTRLSRITRQLQSHDTKRALEDIARQVPDWSGGTRIGEALKHFNYDWGRRVLGRGAVVLLISDGWDRGNIDLLRREMARLQRSCQRLIWLNPLLGSQDYEPLTMGMQAALPFVDDFLAVHNLASLEDLAAHLVHLPDGRPVRRQHAPEIAAPS